MLPFTGSSQLQQQQTSNYPRPPRATDDPSRHSTVSAAPVGGRPDLATVETTARGPLHPLRGAAPDQKGCTAYGSGAAHPTTRTNAESARRGPGCGTRGRRQGLAGQRADAPSEARGADGSRAGRRPRAHKAARPGTTARGALHPIRRGALPTDRVQHTQSQEQTRNLRDAGQAAVPVGGGRAWPDNESTRRAKLAAWTTRGRADAHGCTKQHDPQPQLSRRSADTPRRTVAAIRDGNAGGGQPVA